MKLMEIQKLLSLGEGQRIELKPHCRNAAYIGPSVCGFLNSTGGYIICGVDSRGKVIGVDASAEVIADFEKELQVGLSPKALVSIFAQEQEGKSLLIIEVPAGKDVPYAFRDVIYIRSDDSTRKADVETIRDLVMRREIAPERWERRFSFADLENDVDIDEINLAVADAKKAQRAFFREPRDPVKVLEDFAVSKFGRLTNGGDVLFTRNPAERFPQVRIRAAFYPSSKANGTFRDMKSFEGPLVQVLEQTCDFIVRNTATLANFSAKSLKREDRPLYPEEAVREGLVNAFAHRDYTSPSGGITVGIYPDRLEIWNSGALPYGITPEKLMTGNLSILRNPDIAHVLYLRKLMEKLGRGSILILDKCKEYDLPQPEWKSNEQTGVTLTFFAPHVTPHVTPHVSPHVTPHVEKLLLALHGELSRSELMAAMGLKDRKHFSNSFLRPALENVFIEMTVPDKPRSTKQKYRLTSVGETIRDKHNRQIF